MVCRPKLRIDEWVVKGVSSLFKTDGFCQICCNFSLSFTCQTTVIFGIMRDRNRLIHVLVFSEA